MNPGEMLAHYRIVERLGAGGMGVVYKALDTHLNRAVAIKVLPADAVRNTGRRERFVQEAHAASALDHPNIVTVYDITEAEGRPFMVMQYVAGKTLRALLERGPLALRDALRYAVQIADALSRAHARGIVHRDLKPENVMVNEEDQVKVLDFGLAKLTEMLPSEETVSGAAPALTEEGAVVGTAAYMSPEQAQGKKVDARSDIFSFGAVLYEMVSGRQTFRGENRLAVLSAVVREEPEKLAAATPAELDKLIWRSLRKNPERRLQSMADARNILGEIKEESDSGQAPARAEVLAPRRRWAWAAAVALVAAAIPAAALWFRATRPTTAPPAAANLVPLTSFPGREMYPALSPDAKQVAFSWEGENRDNFDIYVKLVDAGAPLRLTTDPGTDFFPAWSPDGRYIAFARLSPSRRPAVFMVPVLGGTERRLTEGGEFGLAWSPDGKFLAVSERSSPQDPSAIFLLSTDTGEKPRLTAPPSQSYGDYYPAFSPDGQTLAFVRSTQASATAGDVYLVAARPQGKTATEPTLLIKGTFVSRPTWTPDGRSIIYATSSFAVGAVGLWRSSVSGGEPVRLEAAGDGASSPSVSALGVGNAWRLAFQRSMGGDSNVWRIAGPAAREKPSIVKLIASTRPDTSAQYSPDGKRIAFLSGRTGNLEIWACDSDGKNPVQLTSFAGPQVGSPRWSPDGRWVALDDLRDGQRDIYVVAAEGGFSRRLTSEPTNEVRPSWSQDGRWIYFGSNRSGDWQVWKVPAESGPPVQVTRNGGREAFESSDGKFLYYAKFPPAVGIWRIPTGGGEETQVLDQGSQGGWAITTRGIFFFDLLASPGPAIKLFDPSTRRLATVAELPAGTTLATGVTYLAVSPDARWILYAQVDQTESDILMLDNFR